MSEQEIWLLLDSSDLGGIETHVVELACGLNANGFGARVVFFESHGDHPLKPKLRALNIPHTELGGGLLNLRRALRQRKPTLLHTHGYKAGILGRLAGLGSGTPVVSSYHAGEPGQGRVRLYVLMDRLTARLAKEIIAVSAPIAKALPKRTRVIGNFVSLGKFSQTGTGKIAFVGRLSREKGPDLFCRLSEWLSVERLTLFGDGPMRTQLEAHYPNVRFEGQQASMDERWSEIGLLCMTSRNEGLPLAALEAMANGIPVIAFKVGGLANLIKPNVNGWLVEPGDLAGFARTVRRWTLLEDERKREMALSTRRIVSECYSTDAVIPRFLAVYATAVG